MWCGTESNRALSAVEEASNSRLNMCVSNVQESSIWETEGAERRELICSALSGGTTELKNLQLQNRGNDWSGNQTQLRKWRLFLLQVHYNNF